jgi:hypothetical protein
MFKYSPVLSAKESRPLYNYNFAPAGYNGPVSQDQLAVGGSLAESSFYSILGTVKVSF